MDQPDKAKESPQEQSLNKSDQNKSSNSQGDGVTLQKPTTAEVTSPVQKNKDAKKDGIPTSEVPTPSITHKLKAPYAQPVLDASKLSNKRSSVDERIAAVRERRLHQQHLQEQGLAARHMKEEATFLKWEQTQEERKKKIEINKFKDESRRKEIEQRKKQLEDETKKKAEAIVARTEQQSTVVLRQKRSASADRTKRWSWGAGGCGGGGPSEVSFSTFDSTTAPFHYFDPNRLTKHITSNGMSGAHPTHFKTASNLDLSRLSFGGSDESNSGKAGSGMLAFGASSPPSAMQGDRFSKSPLLVGTAHIAFASGLRSYESAQSGNTSKASSPATTPRSGRTRSTDSRTKPRTPSSGPKQTPKSSSNEGTSVETSASRGRSPAARRSQSLRALKASPQLTETSARLLAPTKASIARSKQNASEDTSAIVNFGGGPVRSRSFDRKSKERPSSAKSDTSSNASSVNSPRSNSGSSKTQSTRRTPSPSVHKSKSPSAWKPASPATNSTNLQSSTSSPNLSKARGQSPQHRPSPRSVPPQKSQSQTSTKRGTSPARQQSPSSSGPSSAGSKRTLVQDYKQSPKASPPVIKQSLRPSLTATRPRSSMSPASTKTKITDKKTKPSTKAAVKAKETPKVREAKDKTSEEPTSVPNLEANAKPESNVVVDQPPVEAIKVAEQTANDQSQESDHDTKETDVTEVSITFSNAVEIVADDKVCEPPPPDHVASEDNELAGQETSVEPSASADAPSADGEEQKNEETVAPEEEDAKATANSQEALEAIRLDSSLAGEINAVEQKDLESKVENSVETFEESSETDQGSIPEAEAMIPVSETEKVPAGDMSAVGESDPAEKVDELQDDNKKDVKPIVGAEKVTEAASSLISDASSNQVKEVAAISEKENAVNVEEVKASETKKKEKKLTPEQQTYKETMAAKRREAKEKREREEAERQERIRREAEERAARVEEARRMAEEARLEEIKRQEEEKRAQEEAEIKKKEEAEELARKHEEYIREQKEKMEQRAKEDADKLRKEREAAAQQKEDERLARKKRLEMIMRRTRGAESPTPTSTATSNSSSPSNQTVSGDNSPTSLTPSGGRSPQNPSTPDRISSPITPDQTPSVEAEDTNREKSLSESSPQVLVDISKDVSKYAEETIPQSTEKAVPAPMDETAPRHTDEAVPAPTDEAVPAPTDEAVPAPMDEAVPAPTDEAVPAPTDEAVPAPADEAVPAPADEAVPAPMDEAVPAPTDEAVPAPTDEAVPAPTDEAVPAPTDEAVPAPTDEAVPAPTDEAVPAPTDEAVPAPTDEAVPAPADEADPAPADKAVPALADKAIPAPTDEPVPGPKDEAVPAPTTEAVSVSMDEAAPAPTDEAVSAPMDQAVPEAADESDHPGEAGAGAASAPPLIEITAVDDKETADVKVNGDSVKRPFVSVTVCEDMPGTDEPTVYVPVKSQNGSAYEDNVISMNGTKPFEGTNGKDDQFEELNDVPTGNLLDL